MAMRDLLGLFKFFVCCHNEMTLIGCQPPRKTYSTIPSSVRACAVSRGAFSLERGCAQHEPRRFGKFETADMADVLPLGCCPQPSFSIAAP